MLPLRETKVRPSRLSGYSGIERQGFDTQSVEVISMSEDPSADETSTQYQRVQCFADDQYARTVTRVAETYEWPAVE